MRSPKLPGFIDLRNKRIFIGGAALLILFAGGLYWRSRSAENADDGALRPVAVTSGTIEDVVTAQGKLEPGQTVTIRCFFGESGEAVVVEGTVVRQEALSAEDYSLYRSRIAVS